VRGVCITGCDATARRPGLFSTVKPWAFCSSTRLSNVMAAMCCSMVASATTSGPCTNGRLVVAGQDEVVGGLGFVSQQRRVFDAAPRVATAEAQQAEVGAGCGGVYRGSRAGLSVIDRAR